MCVLRIYIQLPQNHDAALLRVDRICVPPSYDLYLPWSMAVREDCPSFHLTISAYIDYYY